ncbi:MAG: carboxy terminal-processing peptidase, partial [Bacteroidota bacterium]
TLSVRKIDDSETDVPLTRDVVVLEETYAKSVILKEEGEKEAIGYIHLPKFYADFNNRSGRRCASDVAKEIQKLQAEGVDGMILDLRNNGGGSLQDVVDMAGLFIEEGPIVQVKSRRGAPQMLRDRDDRILYDGKLVIMVNSFSASASEILAAAIQDYDRGVIVGAPTFGKGTVQRFVDLDKLIPGNYEIKPLGELKMTTQKFYRINGDATQLKGVTPDILLPDEYSLIETGEKEQDYSMPWDEITPANYQTWSEPVSAQVPQLVANSSERVAANSTFDLIQENANRYKVRQDQYTYPLELEAFRTDRKRTNEEAQKYKDIRQEIEAMEIITPMADQAHIESDTVRQKRIETWHKNLHKDLYVFEAMQVVQEMK